MVRFIIDLDNPNGADDDDDDDREPIDLTGLVQACKGHEYGSTLLAVGAGLIARNLNICLISRERNIGWGSIMIGYGLQGTWEGSVSEWFTCLLRSDDFIEAAVSTTAPSPYLAFCKQDVGDSEITYFHEPVRSTGGTMVRFHMPASDPTAPDLILRFYTAAQYSGTDI